MDNNYHVWYQNYWYQPNLVTVTVSGEFAEQIRRQGDTKTLADIINEGYALGVGDI